MAKRRLILIHGRAIKPAEKPMKALAADAIAEGLRRAGAKQTADQIANGQIAYEMVYFGDFNNIIQAANRPKDKKLLTSTDPDHGNSACFPIEHLKAAFADVSTISAFSKLRYEELLKNADDYRFLDEAADFASLLGNLFTLGWLNDKLIASATPDLFAYLTEHSIGSAVRARLGAVLKSALASGDNICLIAHSMGAIVAYDEFWKYSHTTEYDGSPQKSRPISLFVTIGCPLGEEGVRRNLLDGRYSNIKDKYPRNQIANWINVYAEDDYVARAEKMRAAFAVMRKQGWVKDIIDEHIYNCWSYVDNHSGRRVSNPHDLYGYLMHQKVGGAIHAWAKSG
jgi:hypothetical protein